MRKATDLKLSMFRGRILEVKKIWNRVSCIVNGQRTSKEVHAFAAKIIG